MNTPTARQDAPGERRLHDELRRQRRLVEDLCSHMQGEIEALKGLSDAELVDACARLQANLVAVADVERLQAGTEQLAREVFDLHTVVRSAVAQHAFLADAHRVRLRCLVHKDAPRRVVGDGTRLRRLLGDLVAEALPHSSGGGVFVFIAPEPTTDDRVGVRITIADREDGPPDALRAVPHGRELPAPRISPWHSSARELLRRMGGDFGVQAVDEGVALWFTVMLDTAVPRPRRAELAATAPVLLVTKNQQRAAAVAAVLQRCGIQLALETNEQLVPIRLQEARFSMVLLDRDAADAPEATFALRSPLADDVRTVPLLGLPRFGPGRERVDEAELVRRVRQHSDPRPPR